MSLKSSLYLKVPPVRCRLTFAGSDVVQVQLVALLGPLQAAFGGEEVAGGVVGLVVGAADLENRKTSFTFDPTHPHVFLMNLMRYTYNRRRRDSESLRAQTLPRRRGKWRGPGTHTWGCFPHPPHTLYPSYSDSSGRDLCKNK